MIIDILEKEKKKYSRLLFLLSVLMILLVLIFVTLGEADISISETISVIVNKLFNVKTNVSLSKIAIVWDIRLPRILAGMIIGSGLAVAGVIFQSILRNPLADPYTIGVSTGAVY
jgi:iron complex transport system permease protein